MIQVYSTGLAVNANDAFPFNNVSLDKGCAEVLAAPSTIQLNQRGVYLVEMDGFATGAAAGNNLIQLYVNGVAMPQAMSSFTTVSGDVSNYNFKSFVQVANNNCNCNCLTSPTIIQIINGEQALTDAHINVVVTKIR